MKSLKSKIYLFSKRALDIFVSSLGLIVAAPIMFFTSIAVLLIMGRPVIFKQKRPGLFGRPFTIYKFRTMKNASSKKDRTLSDGERLTVLGVFLRKTSIDELPELVNVLKGDMSLVGPRPLLLEYLPLYSPEQARRHDVKPGMTGWAQVKGRNVISWEEKFAMDLWYVDNKKIFLDLKILIITVFIVATVKGINAPGEATAKSFNGNVENSSIKF